MREIDQLFKKHGPCKLVFLSSPCQRMTLRLGGWYYLSPSFLPKNPRCSTPVCPVIAKAGETKDSVLFLFVPLFQLVLTFSLNIYSVKKNVGHLVLAEKLGLLGFEKLEVVV